VSHRGAVVRRKALGVLVLAGLVAAVVLLWQRPNPFASTETVRADVADANGLAATGADVRVAGVPVGKVTRIARAGNTAQLTMTLDPAAGVVHRDATLAIRPRLLFEGTAYVELTLGSPGAPVLGPRVIPVAQTSTYVPLDDTLSVLGPRTRGNVQSIVQTLGTLGRSSAPVQLRDTLGAAPRLLDDAALDAAAARGPGQSALASSVRSFAGVASAVASQSPALSQSVVSSSHTFAALDADGGRPLGQTLAALPGTAAQLTSGAEAASAIVSQLSGLVPRLEPGARRLAPAIAQLRPLLRSATPVLRTWLPLLADAQTAITGVERGASPALGAISALRPTLATFQNTLLAALEQKTDLGDPAYLAFLGLFAGGGGASRPFGVDGQGHFMRFGLRFLTGAGQPLPPCTLLEQVSPTVAKAVEAGGGCTP
jgi:phospholipid/cholesterol/gamma-HCH transport system substrate-binding protein